MQCINSCLDCCKTYTIDCPLWRSSQTSCPNDAPPPTCPHCTGGAGCSCDSPLACGCRSIPVSLTARDEQQQQQQSIINTARLYEPVYIDVIVPQVAPQTPESAAPVALSQSSVSVENQTMYSMQDLHHSTEVSHANLNSTLQSNASYSNDGAATQNAPSPTFPFDSAVGLSFTNNFREVNKLAVSTFLENVEKLIERQEYATTTSEENVPGSSSVVGSDGAAAATTTALSSSMPLTKLTIPGSPVITSDEYEYIHEGGDIREMTQRLAEVEYATRQNIVARWNVNQRLLQLAAMRIVPTLRTHRHVDVMQDCPAPSCCMLAGATTAAGGGAQQHSSSHRPPVLVIHTGDLMLDSTACASPLPVCSRKKSSPLHATAPLDKAISSPLIKVIDPPSESYSCTYAEGDNIPVPDLVAVADEHDRKSGDGDGGADVDWTPAPPSAEAKTHEIWGEQQQQQQTQRMMMVPGQTQGQMQGNLPIPVISDAHERSPAAASPPVVMMQHNPLQKEVLSAAPNTTAASAPAAATTTTISSTHAGGNYVNTVHHLEMLALSCHAIRPGAPVGATIEHNTWDFLSTQGASAVLNRGDCIFRFLCTPANQLDTESLNMIDMFINISSFDNEVQQNNSPIIHIKDPYVQAQYITILVKVMYMLPNVRLDSITPAIMSSCEYQKACQPNGNKVERCDESDTFRINLTIIRFVFSMTVQFKVSEITNPTVLKSFRYMDGITPVKALILERTKRNMKKIDSTAKVRSVLLYYAVNGGLLVSNQTIVMNTSLPSLVSKIINTFGSSGASQSQETVKLTRAYFAKKAQ